MNLLLEICKSPFKKYPIDMQSIVYRPMFLLFIEIFNLAKYYHTFEYFKLGDDFFPNFIWCFL